LTAATAVDWNGFLEVGVPLWIAAVGSAVAAVISSLNRRSLKTPSGEAIGTQVEKTHHLTATNTALLVKANGRAVKQEADAKEKHDA